MPTIRTRELSAGCSRKPDSMCRWIPGRELPSPPCLVEYKSHNLRGRQVNVSALNPSLSLNAEFVLLLRSDISTWEQRVPTPGCLPHRSRTTVRKLPLRLLQTEDPNHPRKDERRRNRNPLSNNIFIHSKGFFSVIYVSQGYEILCSVYQYSRHIVGAK